MAPMPGVAGLGWLSQNYFPSVAAAGLAPTFKAAMFPPESFVEVRVGAVPPPALLAQRALIERLSILTTQQSAVGMRLGELAPGAPVQLDNLHPRQPSWAFALADERPRSALQLPDSESIELEPKIRPPHHALNQLALNASVY